MQKSPGNGENSNPNSRTIEVLLEMAAYYEQIRDTWRALAYRKACNTLRRQTQQIKFAEDAVVLPFIGERCDHSGRILILKLLIIICRLSLKIEEIVWTDRLRRLDYAKLEADDFVLQKFLKIYGRLLILCGHTIS